MTLHLLKVATHKIAVRFYKSSFLKQKLTNLFLVTVVAQFTAKTSNLEKAIYVWSLILLCIIFETFRIHDFNCFKICLKNGCPYTSHISTQPLRSFNETTSSYQIHQILRFQSWHTTIYRCICICIYIYIYIYIYSKSKYFSLRFHFQ